ncbi:dihydroxyacetone kinase subunit DhaL [Lichenicoccus roseus]|uniref:Dihydroxyacetone kinase subunit L n=1 Tax=Lichenicoccus roseus TaxID=2683649 RepID=A0A5R9J310_9PROT|nr:dihydroxyacetone kinase subunit DhaL [Lichenicoccus roseus]TLU72015.1 dihydroxyacetone kinase subunit L [Lichenicoccus roseus]
MADELDAVAVRAMLLQVCTRMIENTDRLTEADQAVGDGDHGIGMRRGFTAARDKLEALEPASVAEVFKTVGTAVMAQTGGASGAVFGTLYRAGATACGDHALDAATFLAFLEQGLAAVQKRGGAVPGAKTMIDALAPAAEAARAAQADGLAAMIRAAADAAQQGVQASRDMIATTGKARTLGERSLGHPDPGAISMQIQLAAMQDYVAGQRED